MLDFCWVRNDCFDRPGDTHREEEDSIMLDEAPANEEVETSS